MEAEIGAMIVRTMYPGAGENLAEGKTPAKGSIPAAEEENPLEETAARQTGW